MVSFHEIFGDLPIIDIYLFLRPYRRQIVILIVFNINQVFSSLVMFYWCFDLIVSWGQIVLRVGVQNGVEMKLSGRISSLGTSEALLVY